MRLTIEPTTEGVAHVLMNCATPDELRRDDAAEILWSRGYDVPCSSAPDEQWSAFRTTVDEHRLDVAHGMERTAYESGRHAAGRRDGALPLTHYRSDHGLDDDEPICDWQFRWYRAGFEDQTALIRGRRFVSQEPKRSGTPTVPR
jgi:hypothetical protein